MGAKARVLVIGLAALFVGCGSNSLRVPDGGGDANGGAGGQTQDAVPDSTPDLAGQPTAPKVAPSAGCGTPAAQALGKLVPYSVHVTGATLDPSYTAPSHDRGYAVWLPKSYDPNVPTRTVFTAEGCMSMPSIGSSFLPGDGGDPDAIYVGLLPPPASVDPGQCWDNTGPRSTAWEYFALVAKEVERTLCVDRNTEAIATAYSGGVLANMLGCYFSKADPNRVFGPELAIRAQVSLSGSVPKDLPTCAGPIAALWIHDKNEFPPPSESRASLERVLGLNGCAGSAVEDWGTGALLGAGCKKYSSCPRDYPVVFCETTGRGRQSGYGRLGGPALAQLSAELQSAPTR